MTLEFLEPDAAVEHGGRTVLARSPMEGQARAAGARFEAREGWNVPVAYAASDGAGAASVGWADTSHLRKVEVCAREEPVRRVLAAAGGGVRLELGTAQRIDGAWWCPVTPERALVLGGDATLRDRLEQAAQDEAEFVSVVDLTTTYAALTLVGPRAREAFARFTALDLRPKVTPVHAFRPGSVARTPGYVLREEEDRYLMLFGAALGHYVWEQVADAATHLGGGPIGADALAPLEEGASSHA